jgi:hypothetical protein
MVINTVLKIVIQKIFNFVKWTSYNMYLMVQFTYYDQWLLGFQKHVSCLLHFLFEPITCTVFLLEDVSCHGLWIIRDATEEMSVSFQALRKCWLGFVDTTASSFSTGTSCHSCSVCCPALRRLSWGSILIEWYCYIWLNPYIILHLCI